jgi:transposase
MAQGYFVGVDLHKTVIQICVLDTTGEVVRERRLEGLGTAVWKDVEEVLGPYRDQAKLVVEAVGVNRWFVDRCLEAKIDVVVANPARLGLKQAGKKTDRRDARELARRLLLGDIERSARSYYASDEEYGQRKTVRIRHQLVEIRQQLVNQIRALLNAYRERPPVRDLWRPRSLAWLRCVSLPAAGLTKSLTVLATTLEAVQASIATMDVEIRAAAARSSTAQLLMTTVPSVGAQTALTLSCELGDVRRFRTGRAVASQAGLAPRVNNSGDRQHHGSITKQGSSELRWILSQMAVRLLARDELARRWAAPRLRRMHVNKVRVTLARRLLIGMHHTLTTGEEFCLARCLAM